MGHPEFSNDRFKLEFRVRWVSMTLESTQKRNITRKLLSCALILTHKRARHHTWVMDRMGRVVQVISLIESNLLLIAIVSDITRVMSLCAFPYLPMFQGSVIIKSNPNFGSC